MNTLLMPVPESEQTDNCIDCGINVFLIKEYAYAVKDALWAKYVGHCYCGLICIACLEKRIGRQLTKYDFDFWPINIFTKGKSERLKDRLKEFQFDIMEPMMKGG